MTDHTESPIKGLRTRIETRRRNLRALRRRGHLIALGLVGLAYDRARAGLSEANEWLDHVAARGEEAEQDLRNTREAVQTRLDETLNQIQERGETLQAEARAALRKVVTPPPSVQEDIPVTTPTDDSTVETPTAA